MLQVLQSDILNTVSTFINVHVVKCERSIYLAMHPVREFLFSCETNLLGKSIGVQEQAGEQDRVYTTIKEN